MIMIDIACDLYAC